MEKQKHSAKILIIEDNVSDVYFLRYAFEQHQYPYELQLLSDGDEAIRFMQEHCSGGFAFPCVIILDLRLPSRSGIEVMRTIRECPPLNHVAVVVLTGFGSEAEEQLAVDLGARLYKTKPLDLDEWIKLAGKILKICGEHRPTPPTHV